MAKRLHKITHPVLGVVTWAEMKSAIAKIYDETGKRVCSWCHQEVPSGCRTRCGKELCKEMIWRARSWNRCARVVKRAAKSRCACGKYASEVDHIIPVSLGGTGDQENLRALCSEHHLEATRRLRRLGADYVAKEEQHANQTGR